jgi:transcriptional regulator of acetoin/glycerol metabolism
VSDVIDSLMIRIRHIEPHITAEKALRLERELRLEFGGTVTRTRKRLSRDQLRVEVSRRFNGRNIQQVASELGVHRATIYRVLNSRPRKPEIR